MKSIWKVTVVGLGALALSAPGAELAKDLPRLSVLHLKKDVTLEANHYFTPLGMAVESQKWIRPQGSEYAPPPTPYWDQVRTECYLLHIPNGNERTLSSKSKLTLAMVATRPGQSTTVTQASPWMKYEGYQVSYLDLYLVTEGQTRFVIECAKIEKWINPQPNYSVTDRRMDEAEKITVKTLQAIFDIEQAPAQVVP